MASSASLVCSRAFEPQRSGLPGFVPRRAENESVKSRSGVWPEPEKFGAPRATDAGPTAALDACRYVRA